MLAKSQLEISHGEIVFRPSQWYPNPDNWFLGEAYRICCGQKGARGRAILTAFARERDAVAAKKALEARGLVTEEALRAAGRDEVERVMAEAMCW
jgi:hypothetical protein